MNSDAFTLDEHDFFRIQSRTEDVAQMYSEFSAEINLVGTELQMEEKEHLILRMEKSIKENMFF